jgi:hypothetical protein
MDIIHRIEKMREELLKIGNSKGFQDHEVIHLSQKLDKLINAYYRLERKKTIKIAG